MRPADLAIGCRQPPASARSMSRGGSGGMRTATRLRRRIAVADPRCAGRRTTPANWDVDRVATIVAAGRRPTGRVARIVTLSAMPSEKRRSAPARGGATLRTGRARDDGEAAGERCAGARECLDRDDADVESVSGREVKGASPRKRRRTPRHPGRGDVLTISRTLPWRLLLIAVDEGACSPEGWQARTDRARLTASACIVAEAVFRKYPARSGSSATKLGDMWSIAPRPASSPRPTASRSPRAPTSRSRSGRAAAPATGIERLRTARSPTARSPSAPAARRATPKYARLAPGSTMRQPPPASTVVEGGDVLDVPAERRKRSRGHRELDRRDDGRGRHRAEANARASARRRPSP